MSIVRANLFRIELSSFSFLSCKVFLQYQCTNSIHIRPMVLAVVHLLLLLLSTDDVHFCLLQPLLCVFLHLLMVSGSHPWPNTSSASGWACSLPLFKSTGITALRPNISSNGWKEKTHVVKCCMHKCTCRCSSPMFLFSLEQTSQACLGWFD